MLTHAKLRDRIVKRTGYRQDAVAHMLHVMYEVIADELLQQGEVALQGLFRVVPVARCYCRNATQKKGEEGRATIRRLVLQIRPIRSLRKRLNSVPLPG